MNYNKKNTLLIVDDDTSSQMILTHILQSDYNVRVAMNGPSAIKIAEKYLPDLIILDIIMPDMDGYQVFTALRNLDKTAHIPIIFISGLKDSHNEKKGLQMGAVDYISKPFDDIVVSLRVRHQIRIINQLRTIERLSMVDQLTGIPNRRNFEGRLRVEWGRALRESAPLCLLLIDVDHFKVYNDTYGHQQGDLALCRIARVIIQTLKRAADFAARWGGEEFVALLPNADHSGGLALGERIRKNIEAAEIYCEKGYITKLTASVGVNMQTPTASSAMYEFFSGADKALYQAKNTGRNRVCLYE